MNYRRMLILVIAGLGLLTYGMMPVQINEQPASQLERILDLRSPIDKAITHDKILKGRTNTVSYIVKQSELSVAR